MRRTGGKFLTTLIAVVLAVAPTLMATGVLAQEAAAQSPVPPWYMYNTSSNTLPPPAPNEAFGPNAVMVYANEGWGPACGHSIQDTESWTKHFITNHYQTITEVSIFGKSCSGTYHTISDYIYWITGMVNWVEQNTTNPGQYWGGIMLDEEAGWGFTASQYQLLNADIENLMAGTTGMSWIFSNPQPNAWDVNSYYNVIYGTWVVPQVYNQSFLNAVNNECAVHADECTNVVQLDSLAASPYNNYQDITPFVSGYAYVFAYWGGSTWCAYWRPT